MEIIISLGINVVTEISKQFIEPRFGKKGVQAFVGILSLLVAGIIAFATVNPSVLDLLKKAGLLLVQSIAIYEIAIKRMK